MFYSFIFRIEKKSFYLKEYWSKMWISIEDIIKENNVSFFTHVSLNPNLSPSSIKNSMNPVSSDRAETLEDKDFIIIPANQAACLYPCYITDINNTDAGWGTFSVYAPFKKNNTAIQGSVTSDLRSKGLSIDTSQMNIQTTNGLVDTFDWNGFEMAIKDFITKNYYATSQGVTQENPQTINEDVVDFTADVLDEKPTYIIKVVKTY